MKTVDDIYPSRTGDAERIIPRVDPVVYGDVQPEIEYSLNQSQLEHYDENGFVTLPDYMPEMVEPMLLEMEKLKSAMAGEEELFTEPDSNEVRTIFKPFAYSKLFRDFSCHPKILTIAQQILDSDVSITQSRINVKPAYKGKSFPWHSDFETWHVEDGMPRMRALTAWIMLTENTEFNGPLYVIPGSHKVYVSCTGITQKKNHFQSLKMQKAGVPKPDTINQVLQNRDIKAIHGKPGTVVFHECNLIHGSPDNISGDPRALLMVVYNSNQNKLVKPFCGLSPRPHYLRNPDQTAVKVCQE